MEWTYLEQKNRNKKIYDIMSKGISADKAKKALELTISRQRIQQIYLNEKRKAQSRAVNT